MWLRIFLVSCLLWSASSYKILVLMSIPVQSHDNLARAAAEILHENGHQVTYVSPFAKPNPGYQELVVPEILPLKKLMNVGFDFQNRSRIGAFTNFAQIFLPKIYETFMNNEKVKALDGESFDAVILEYIINEAFIGFAVKFDCPLVMISSLPMMTPLTELTRNLVIPAMMPNIMLPFASDMTFIQRAKNLAMYLFEITFNNLITVSVHKSAYEKFFPKEASRVKYEDLYSRVSMTLINSHPTVTSVRPLLPNAVEIAGYHIGKVEPLPKDLQSILDNSKNGVIYFSLGSNLKTSTMEPALRDDILRALGSVKYTILWKFEDVLEGKPDNVIIRKWMPQNSILAHKNVKLFITHSGLLSTTEAVHFGVPTLNIPVFGDQQHNAIGSDSRGTSVTLDFNNITSNYESLLWAMNEMMTNPKYEETAKKHKSIFHNRPMAPRDALNFYVEYVIKTNGAKFLEAPYLSYHELWLLDVIFVFLVLPIVVLVVIGKCLCNFCKRKCCPQKKLKTQ